MAEIGLKDAINAISDVVQNRPRPIREFDQIYMKTGDMVIQSEIVANWANGRRLAFIGDGDAIGVCVAYLQKREIDGRPIFDFGPSKITVFDFDERNVNAVRRFADKERLDTLDAELYNCLDAFPEEGRYDHFYCNPPWGASNGGESVNVFLQRGFEAIGYRGHGLVVLADDDELEWTKVVLANVQAFAASRGFYVSRMQRKLHEYHLDDAPTLRSCNLFLSSVPGAKVEFGKSQAIDLADERLVNFYGRSQPPRVHYVKERKGPGWGKAVEEEYSLEWMEEGK